MPTCMSNTTGRTLKPGLSYHRIPAQPDRARQWLLVLKRAYIDIKTFKPSKNTVVCSEHFNETDFEVDTMNRLVGEYYLASKWCFYFRYSLYAGASSKLLQ